MSVDVGAILAGLEAELAVSSEPVRVTVSARRSLGDRVWSLSVDPGRAEGRFDESLEAARAYWPGGGADVSAVLSDPPELHLRFVAGAPPPVGDYVWLYPPKFLEPLLRVWQGDEAGERAAEIALACSGEGGGAFAAPRPAAGSSLRARQREAFGLLSRRVGFLDGPPGTGKTHVLGAMIAAALEQGAASRVLLVAATNAAVDLALGSCDAHSSERASRRRFVRSGYHYAPEAYVGREHLLPEGAQALLGALAEVHARKPSRSDASSFAAWRGEEQWARRRLRAHAAAARKGARLVAMTVANALSLHEELEREPFDLVVFDEASQVGRAAGLAVAGLGKRALFAGDPRQLGPVVLSDDPASQRWLGTSMFLHRRPGAPNACFLDEQSRMAPPINALVSSVFYESKLLVAADASSDPGWRAHRRLDRPGFEAVTVRDVEPGGGRVRASSIRAAVEVAASLSTHGLQASELLVLTPFRRQREGLRAALDAAGFGEASVSTVHRAQGREARVVVFDPVDEASDFLAGEGGRRLVNVALSRAQARLVLLLSPGRLAASPLLRAVALAAARGDGQFLEEPPFRLTDLAPLLARGGSLEGARLLLGGGRVCDVTRWDRRARRGEAVDSTGAVVSLAAPAQASEAPGPGPTGGLERLLGATLSRSCLARLFEGCEADDEREARVRAAAAASRLGAVWGPGADRPIELALDRARARSS